MRKALLNITYDSSDISADISDRLISFTYNDNKSGTADDIELVLENIDNIWINDWYPSIGATLSASLVLKSWDSDTDINVTFGTFTIDELTADNGGTFTIKAIASICDTDFMSKQEYTAWEETTLSTILDDVAGRHNLQVVFRGDDINYQRITQDNITSAAFITDELSKVGYKLKVSDNKLIVYDDSVSDSGQTLTQNDVTSYSMNAKAFDTYNACEVSYMNVETNEVITHKEIDSNVTNSKTLTIEQYASDVDEAIRIAKSILKSKNAKSVTASISTMGNYNLWSGLTVTLSGFGVFSGDYVIESATHLLDTSGYSTSIEINTGG